MKCPKCDLVTFDHLAQCPRCKVSFSLQRRLTRARSGPDRPILIPRPQSAPAQESAAAPPPPLDVAKPAREPEPVVTAAPPERLKIERPSRPPEPEAHAADARKLKERMKQAGQVRRQQEVDLVAEVDPVLPDWYEPAPTSEDVAPPVRAKDAARR